jgi:hypothetical protein
MDEEQAYLDQLARDTATSHALQPIGGPSIGALAAQEYAPPMPDVGAPLVSGGPQVSAGVPWANRMADILTTRAAQDENSPVLYRTASPLVNITQQDIDNAIGLSMGFSGGGLATKEVSPARSGLFDPTTGLARKGAAYTKEAQAIQEEIAAGPKGAGPLDLSQQNLISNVEQRPLERYEPPRGVSPRLTEALQNPSVVQGVEQSMLQGRDLYGADKWYHTEPLRQAFINELGPEQGTVAFAKYMDHVAATSPRSSVPENIRNASYQYSHALGGTPLPEPLPYPYGHLAQNLHRQNFEMLTAPQPSSLSAAGAPGTKWDIFANPKPASFSENLQGNLAPVTVDTHAFRNIGMRTDDPRFLGTSLQTIYKPGKDPAVDSLVQRFGEVRGNKVTFRPQQLLAEGKLTMDEAKGIPSFWASKPNPNEYAAAERLYADLGAKHGMAPADAQAAGWAGAGELTGLGSAPTHTFPELFNERVLFTAKMRGENPSKTLSDFITGKRALLSIGGLAPASMATMGSLARQNNLQPEENY